MHLSGTLFFAVLASLLMSSLCSESQERVPANKIDVTSLKDLWRFTTGANKKFLSIGFNHVCLQTQSKTFISVRDKRVRHDRTKCEKYERFYFQFQDDNKVAIKRVEFPDYIACKDTGDVQYKKDFDGEVLYTLSVNDGGDNLAIYNPLRKKYLRSREDGAVRCDGDPQRVDDNPEMKFLGWKTGPESSWVPKDSGVILDTLVNKEDKPRSQSIDALVGTVINENRTEVGFRANPVIGGFGLKKIFENYKDSPTATDWSAQEGEVFLDLKTVKHSVNLPPKSSVRVYQVVGTYGALDIYSDNFLEINTGPPS